MSGRNIFRVAPACKGVQLANAWRIWSQGEEFYAASRDLANRGKISFHRNGNWQHRLASGVSRLAPPLRLSGGWLHALEIVYLIGDGVLLPRNQREGVTALVETPPLHKLLVDLLLSESPRPAHQGPPPEMRGATLKAMRLRSGKTLLVVGRVMPFVADYDAALVDMRTKLRVNFTQLPESDDLYVEAMLQSFQHGAGNVVQIFPIGPDYFAFDSAPA